MKCSEFVFDYAHLLYYKCHKIDLNGGGSYIDSLDWICKTCSMCRSVKKVLHVEQVIQNIVFLKNSYSFS